MSQLAPLAPALPFLAHASRGMGRRICGAPGAGKTRITARLLMAFDLLAGLPIIAIDPVGALSNDFLDVIDRQPRWIRNELEARILYVNMAGMTVGEARYVHPFPFLVRSGNESFYTVAHRYLDVLLRTWPALRQSPVLGEAAVVNIAENVLIALCAAGGQITEAESLLRNLAAWTPRLLAAREREPEAAPAIDYLLNDYAQKTNSEKQKDTLSFFRRVSMFRLDQSLRAIYGASTPSVTPAQIVAEKRCVILDYRNVRNTEQRKLGLLWLYHYCNDYFRERGPGGRANPIAFYIDELSYLLPPGKKRDELIADDLSELLSRTARNNGIFVSVIHQDLHMFDEDTNVLLSRLGTQILGASSDVKGAAQIAERFFRYQKTKAKDWQNVWTSDGPGSHFVIDKKPVYETPQEQIIENSYRFLDLEAFQFLVGVAKREGQLPTSLAAVSFADFDAGVFADVARVDQIRALLMQQQGSPVSQILAEIEARRPTPAGPTIEEPIAAATALPSPPTRHMVQPSVRIPKQRTAPSTP
jgi:hypothetical protein